MSLYKQQQDEPGAEAHHAPLTERDVSQMRLTLLDGFRLEVGGLECELPRGGQRVLALLALSGRPGRSGVAGQLWPDVSDKHALGSLRTVLYRLQSICPDVVRSCGDTLELTGSVRVDFSAVTAWALGILSDEPDTGAAQAQATAQVPEGAYRGELLPGWYEEWVLLEREQFHQLRMHALEALSARLVSAGRYGEALYAAHSAVRAAPLRESAHRAVIRIHLAEGNITEAVRQYESFRDLLRAEVDAEPSPLMQGLLGQHDPSSFPPPHEEKSHVTGRARLGRSMKPAR